MAKEVKAARVVLHELMLLFECPYCGMTLIKANYIKARKLLDNSGPLPGKTCGKCGGAVVVKLNDEIKEHIRVKSEAMEG